MVEYRFKTLEEFRNQYPINENGDICCYHYFTKEMYPLLGKHLSYQNNLIMNDRFDNKFRTAYLTFNCFEFDFVQSFTVSDEMLIAIEQNIYELW